MKLKIYLIIAWRLLALPFYLIYIFMRSKLSKLYKKLFAWRYPRFRFIKEKWIDKKTYTKLLVLGTDFFGEYVLNAHPKLRNRWGGALARVCGGKSAEDKGYKFCLNMAWKYRHKDPKLSRGFLEIGKHWRPGAADEMLRNVLGFSREFWDKMKAGKD